MAPAIDLPQMQVTEAQIKSENKKSLLVLQELLSKLSVSNAKDEVASSANDLATFINGDIEEHDAPVQ